jgi:hypothetical protein
MGAMKLICTRWGEEMVLERTPAPFEFEPVDTRNRFRGGPIELEEMDSANPPLGVRCLYLGRHRQRHRGGREEVHETLQSGQFIVTVL